MGWLLHYFTTPPTLATQHQQAEAQCDTRGNLKVTLMALNSASAQTSESTSEAASATATGSTIYKNAALKATKAQVKGSGANLYGYHIYNLDSSVTYLQFFNVLAAGVTVGTTVPDFVLVVPANGWLDLAGFLPPISFATALTVAATTTYSGLTAQSNGLVVNLLYA